MNKFRDTPEKRDNSWEKDNQILTEKIQKDAGCLIDINELEKGNFVFSISRVYVQVTAVVKESNFSYPITIDGGESYTAEGKKVSKDKYPTLFKSNPFEYLYNKINILTVEKSQLKQENDNLWERLRAQGPGA